MIYDRELKLLTEAILLLCEIVNGQRYGNRYDSEIEDLRRKL